MRSLPYNPVLLYKEQGSVQDDEMDNLGDNDFLLCIQTEFQRDALQAFGNDTICIDSTHGTNMYNFNLVTIVVIDEYGEGVPVGWMLSNREDAMAIIPFFTAIKARCDNIIPNWFMSDDSDNFFNAWKGVFGEKVTRKIICAWHLDRSWRKALAEHVKDKKEQITIYHILSMLLNERDEAKFRVELQSFLTYAETNHNGFYTYFDSNYCTRLKQWATCYRIRTTSNTNMFLEAFHRVLKIVYLHHKQNRRVDALLVTLLKVARDKAFERLRKKEMGKNTHRISEVNKRHKRAVQLSPTLIKYEEDMKWTVTSQTSLHITYTVQKQEENCSCQIRCSECKICPHNYTCTCIDSILHSTVCTHVHLVHMQSAAISPQQSSDNPEITNYDYFTHVLSHRDSNQTLTSAKNSFLSKLHKLDILASQCKSLDAILSGSKHLQAAITVMTTIEMQTSQKSLSVKRKVSPNQNCEHQQKFFSTKKRRTNCNTRSTFSKPSSAQLQEVKITLEKEHPRYCGS